LAAVSVCAEAAEARWGLAGVVAHLSAGETAVLLITPSAQLPAGHPLAAGGLDPEVAGLLALWGTARRPDEAAGRWLVSTLAALLARRCPALEAQASAWPKPNPLAPSPFWAAAVGFRPLGFPPLRYRYDIAAGLPARPAWAFWLDPQAWRRPQPLPAGLRNAAPPTLANRTREAAAPGGVSPLGGRSPDAPTWAGKTLDEEWPLARRRRTSSAWTGKTLDCRGNLPPLAAGARSAP
jgi:hypothetical protein